MLVIPAIDLKNGQCVRLQQGDMEQVTVFGENPEILAQHWLEQGARRLHLVDLDGAFAGKTQNAKSIEAVLNAINGEIPVQLGGGIRECTVIEKWLDIGVNTVVIGTAAVKKPGFLHDACSAFPGHIMVGLDARDGKVAVDGWAKMTGHDVVDLAQKFADYGCEAIIYTDVGRDGMLSGINLQATRYLAQQVHVPIIASGGLSSLEDIYALREMAEDGVTGVIAGRSIYDGTLDFVAAQTAADHGSST